MGKISYRPNRNNSNKQLNKVSGQAENGLEEENYKEFIQTEEPDNFEGEGVCKEYRVAATHLNNIKPVGDLECEYHIYIEDYVYTYLYQFAQVDLTTESSAVFLGEFCLESKEVIVRGIIPVPMEKLSAESEWIDEEILKEVDKERELYFKNQSVIGWMHMQPGYGTMLTMKELREHRRAFGNKSSIFMLVDAINKIETLFIYEDEELKEQSGYYMYYERNEEMQKYMLDHPFIKKDEEITEDNVVSQFREIGKLRKQEYIQRKNVNLTVIIASIVLIGLSAVIVRMNDSKNIKSSPALSPRVVMEESNLGIDEQASKEDKINFIIKNEDPAAKEKQLEQVGEPGKLQDTSSKEAAKENEETSEISIDSSEIMQNTENTSENTVQTNNQNEKKIPEHTVPATDKQEVKESKEEKYEEYVVKEGDTLANISYDKFGSAKRSKEIARINELGDTNVIRVGQTLKLPKD